MNLGIVLASFVVIFPAELPDKSTIAALVLGAKYKPLQVFVGAGLAFAVQTLIAVFVGHLLGLLPHRPLQLIIGLLFTLGAILLLKGLGRMSTAKQPGRQTPHQPSPWRVSALAFGIIFMAEFGDLTQIAIANLTAKFHYPISVAVGSTLALWAVGAIAIWGGKSVLKLMPIRLFTQIAAGTLALLAIMSFVSALQL